MSNQTEEYQGNLAPITSYGSCFTLLLGSKQKANEEMPSPPSHVLEESRVQLLDLRRCLAFEALDLLENRSQIPLRVLQTRTRKGRMICEIIKGREIDRTNNKV